MTNTLDSFVENLMNSIWWSVGVANLGGCGPRGTGKHVALLLIMGTRY